MKGSRRVTVRLPNDVWELLKGATNDEIGIDKSAVVRQALKAHLGPDGTFKGSLTLPEELGWRKAQYLGWGNGDLRKELREQLAEIVACAQSCWKLWQQTPGMLEAYETLLTLYRLLGPNRSVGQ